MDSASVPSDAHEVSRMNSSPGKWGIDTWMLEALPLERAVRTLDEAGIECLEYAYESFRRFEKEGTIRARIRALLDETSTCTIEPSQMHAPYGDLDVQLAADDESARSQAINCARHWLEYGNMLGVRVMVFHTVSRAIGGELSAAQVSDARDANLRAFKEIGRIAIDVGVKVAVENRLEGTYGSRPLDLLEIVSADPDALGVCLDTGHANVNRYVCGEFVKEVNDRLIATHIHDNDGRSDQHLLPFMGNIDWPLFARELNAISYHGPLILEIPGSDHDERLCLNRLGLARELLSSGLLKNERTAWGIRS